jgi:hypothetical protein
VRDATRHVVDLQGQGSLLRHQLFGIGQRHRGVRLHAVVVGCRLEVERRVVLVEEEGVAHGPPLVAERHGDHIEEGPRDPLGEQHREETDERQNLAQAPERGGDHHLGDDEQPLDQWPPAGDVRIAMELQLNGIGNGHGHRETPPSG